jgi:hypothetical protein
MSARFSSRSIELMVQSETVLQSVKGTAVTAIFLLICCDQHHACIPFTTSCTAQAPDENAVLNGPAAACRLLL